MVFQSQLQLQLSSNNVDSKGDDNFIFYIPTNAIPAEQQEHIYISVQSAVIPNTFYNINEHNNLLRYSVEPHYLIHNLLIEPGNYNIRELVYYINSNMENFTVSYNKISNKLTFTNNNNTNFKFYSQQTTIYNIFGFQTGISYDSFNGILKSVNAVNLNTIQYINVKLNINTNNITKYNTNDKNIICSIPVNMDPYGVIIYENYNNFKVNTFRNELSEVIIQFTDQNGNIINFNGVQWSIVLQLDIINFVV